MTSPRPAAFGDYQLEIYLAGLQGTLPTLPMAYPELEARAAQARGRLPTLGDLTPGSLRRTCQHG